MLTTLKDNFRPTWKKIACTLALGLPITLLGLHLLRQSIHHSPLLIVVSIICLLPNAVLARFIGQMSYFAEVNALTMLVLAAVQFLYAYLTVCFLGLAIRKILKP